MSEEKVKNLLSELVDMIDNGSQRDLDRADEISKSILKVIEKELCNDCISRKAAIELVRDVCDAIMSECESWYDPETKDEVYKDIREVDAILKCNKEIRIALRNMPSAKPEIIQCKVCKYSERWYKDRRRCFLWHETGIDVFEDGYCNYAKRRTDADMRGEQDE